MRYIAGVGTESVLLADYLKAIITNQNVPPDLLRQSRESRFFNQYCPAADGKRLQLRAPLVTIANAPFCGAAYTMAQDARIDDGLLDVVVFRGLGVLHLLVHLVAVAGGRALPPPPEARIRLVRTVESAVPGGRPLPDHVDGTAVGATPARFEVVPAALKVLVGSPEAGAPCAWQAQS